MLTVSVLVMAQGNEILEGVGGAERSCQIVSSLRVSWPEPELRVKRLGGWRTWAGSGGPDKGSWLL